MQVHRLSPVPVPPGAPERARTGEQRDVEPDRRERRRRRRRREGRGGGRRATDDADGAEGRAEHGADRGTHRPSPEEVMTAQLIHLHPSRQRRATEAYERSDPD